MKKISSTWIAGLCLATVSLVCPTVLSAEPSAAKDEVAVALPEFEVRDTRTGAYGAKEATSTTRISIPIQDVAQTISVVTRELIDDTQGLRMLDVAKFVTPIVEGQPRGGDRFIIRGFLSNLRFIDGVNVGAAGGGNMSSDQTNVERLEIIKGPNTILVPGGAFGGVVNQLTKSPKFEDFTQLSLRARTYFGSEANVDAGRVFADRKSAARIVATVWDADGYASGSFRRGYLFAPSFTHRFSRDTELILKLETLRSHDSYGLDVAINPAVGTKTGGYARKHPLLPRDNLWGPDVRHRHETRLSSELRFKIGDRVAARLWAMADEALYDNQGAAAGTPAAGNQGGVNPVTGEYEPFRTFGPYNATTRTATVTTVTPSTNTRFNRSAGIDRLFAREAHVKNDYAVEYRLGSRATGTTVAGWTANGFNTHWQNWTNSRPAVDYATGSRVGPDEPLTSVQNRNEDIAQRDLQGFLHQRFNALGDRVIVSGGLARFYGALERVDGRNFPALTGPRTNRLWITDYNVGAVYKPIPLISLFAGYNRIGGALPGVLSAGETSAENFKVGIGDQREYGVKTTLFDQRLTISASSYTIAQTNVSVLNNARVRDPSQPPFIFFDLENHCWEAEFTALVTPQLEVIGNVTHMHMRDVFGIRQKMVPDNAAALFGKYTFRQGRWKGLGLSFGADYTDRVAGEQATLFTAAGVPNQPSFYLAPRVLVQAGVSYRRNRWHAAVVVYNLANEDYILSANNRNVLQPGEPRNVSATIELKF